MIINRTQVKEVCGKINVTKEFLDILDSEVEEIVKKACKRAIENNRTTVMGRDV